MKYIIATKEDLELIYKLVQDTITTVYPKYYPKEVVDFFCELHSRENILKDIVNDYVKMLFVNDILVGTGSSKENYITRVFVLPDFQGRGYGSFIMDSLEKEIAEKYDTIYLDASLAACQLYEHRGYKTKKHERWGVENGVVLVYEIMGKQYSYQMKNIGNNL